MIRGALLAWWRRRQKTEAGRMAHAKSFGTVWRASDSFNVVRLTPERRERADRQRALVSAYRLEVRVVGLEDRNKTQGAGRRAVADFAVGSGGGLGEMTRRKREDCRPYERTGLPASSRTRTSAGRLSQCLPRI
jgi:hypothetical protein